MVTRFKLNTKVLIPILSVTYVFMSSLVSAQSFYYYPGETGFQETATTYSHSDYSYSDYSYNDYFYYEVEQSYYETEQSPGPEATYFIEPNYSTITSPSYSTYTNPEYSYYPEPTPEYTSSPELTIFSEVIDDPSPSEITPETDPTAPPIVQPTPVPACQGSLFNQWILYGASGGGCDAVDPNNGVASIQEALRQYDNNYQEALRRISLIESVLSNPNLPDSTRRTYENSLSEFHNYLATLDAGMERLNERLNELMAQYEAAKRSFVSLCSMGFTSECLAQVPAFMEPDPNAIEAAGRAFCERQFGATQEWQCPYLNALEICEENYNNEIERCEEMSVGRTLCYISAYNEKRRCQANPPGYPGEPGEENGIPVESDQYCELSTNAIPACMMALL